MSAFYERIRGAPKVFDAARADDVLSTLAAASIKAADLAGIADLIGQKGPVRDLLAGAFSGSSYLASLALRDPKLLADCLERNPDQHLADAQAKLNDDLSNAASAKEAMALLRRFKQRLALLTGLADLGGVWPVDETIRALSIGADAAVAGAVRFLLRKAAEDGHILAGADDPAAGYFVIAMGKLGAFELNFSSDIDIIVFYDVDRARLAEGVEPSVFFVRLTRELVRLLQEQTADGYVFRTDLRLRPDAGATQIALSTDAGLSYYESFGQNWERSALIKARVIAGDAEAGNDFLDHLSPFIWRKYLDYAAIADVHAMKRRVHAHKGHAAIAVEGHDIKLGRGGIRDIEFFAQTQQLIVGGRHPELRTRGTLEALAVLAAGGWIAAEAAEQLAEAYRFFRRVENRLQMVGDQQTHIIPADAKELQRLANLCGLASTDDFAEALKGRFERVETHYEALFEKLPASPAETPSLVFAGNEANPATLTALEQYGYTNPDAVTAAIVAWQSGRYAATRSGPARARLTELLPTLLDAFGRTAEPDRALSTFDKVLSKMPAGLQLFSLLAANPSLVRLIADIMGTAPRLANIIGRRPQLLDAVLDPGFFGAIPTPAKLKELVSGAIGQARDYQEALDLARIVGREQAFLIGVRVLSGTISARQAGAAYAALADTLIETLFTRVQAELTRQHGRVPGGEAAVLAMGKLGGREMTATSDLDLIMVYDYAGDDVHSDGEKSLSGTPYYSRLTQRLIAALSASTAQGALYQVDMRLRPSGNQGPVATKLSSFIDYQGGVAWTWEHLALTRARVIAGPLTLRRGIQDTIKSVLMRPRDRTAVGAEVREMRRRIEVEKGSGGTWDLKQVRGGLIDLEFTTQFLQIVSAAQHPDVLDQNTEMALTKLESAGVLATEDAEILIGAAQLYNTLTQVLRLCLEKPFVPHEAPEALKELLARVTEMPDFATLEATLSATLDSVHRAFERLVK